MPVHWWLGEEVKEASLSLDINPDINQMQFTLTLLLSEADHTSSVGFLDSCEPNL